MRAVTRKFLSGALALLVSAQAGAAAVSLFEYAFNIDGTATNGAAPGGVNLGGFDTTTGLGTVLVTVSGPGSHQVGMFADHEIDEAINTFFNENGNATGTAAAGQSWEIDEPGYTFGDLYANFLGNTLDDSSNVPDGLEDDVAMAMAWSFVLQAGETASISFLFSDSAPGSGLYLTQFDPDSLASIHMSSVLNVRDQSADVPEPASLGLVGLGLLGIWRLRRRRPA